MPDFTFTVTVDCETEDEAHQVMSERLDVDEDYGFDYLIGWTPADETITVFTLTIDDDETTTHVALTEAELYVILRENYGDGYEFESNDGLIDFVMSQGVSYWVDHHVIPLKKNA